MEVGVIYVTSREREREPRLKCAFRDSCELLLFFFFFFRKRK